MYKKLIIILMFIICFGAGYICCFFIVSKPDNKIITEIDNKEKQCIENSDNAAEIRNCVYSAKESWNKEIEKYESLLKNAMDSKDYKYIETSQELWKKQNKTDNEIIEKFIFNHGGTIYYDYAAETSRAAAKNRTLFLQEVYMVYSNQL